jgi:hypothetical protein
MPTIINETGEDFLRTCSGTHPLIGASRCVLALFPLLNNFSFLYPSHYTTFESETWQFTKTFDKEYGKNSSEFL